MTARTSPPSLQAVGTGSNGALYTVKLDAQGVVVATSMHSDHADARRFALSQGYTIVSQEAHDAVDLARRCVLQAHGVVDTGPDPVLADTKARITRETFLSMSDPLFVGDAPPPKVGTLIEWKAYRQALRDLTKQAGYPLAITWPKRPGTT